MKKILCSAVILCAVLFAACGGDKGKVTMGSLSGEFDSLSYALGANIGYSLKYQMKDVPFDFDRMAKGIEEGAFEKSTIKPEDALNMLRNYFMNSFRTRSAALAAQRMSADSVRMAGGDSTVVEYGPDDSMFSSPEERDSISYAFGVDIGVNAKNMNIPLQIVWLQEAIKNIREDSAKMTEDQVNQYLQYYFMVKRPAENKEASAKWLEKIEKKSGVKKTESGLLYKVEKMGDESVMAKDDRDVVEVHYKGMNREGKVFDASRLADMPQERREYIEKNDPEFKEEPAKFPLQRVIKGWAEGVKLIGKGGKVTLWIPSELAYGEAGPSREIGPNEALQFEIELVNVEPYVEMPAPAADSTQAVAPAMK